MARKDWLDQSERLLALDEFRALTDQQKRICMEHVLSPEISKYELGQKLGIPQPSVYQFFHSKTWEVLNSELARQQIRELIQLAVKTLRDSMLKGRPDIQLMAATRVLVNAGLLDVGNRFKVTKQDNKMIVFWNDDQEPSLPSAIPVSGIGACSGGTLEPPENGNTDTLLPAPEAEGSTRVAGPV